METKEKKKTHHYVFALYVCDSSGNSQRLYHDLARVCLQHLPGTHTIKTVNLNCGPEDLDKKMKLFAGSLPSGLPQPLKQFISNLPADSRLTVIQDH